MELPPDDDGESLLALLSDDDCETPRKRLRSSPAQTQRLQRGPEAVDCLDLPEDVVNDELDNLFGDVATASPYKRHREVAKGLRRRKTNEARVYPGPTSSEVMSSLIQRKAPDVMVARLGLALDSALQDDVMETFFPPRILPHTEKLGY